MQEVKAKKLDGRAVPKKHNRPHTHVRIKIETPFAERMQAEPEGKLETIVHEALCKHYDLSPVTMQPVPRGGPNRYYVKAGWVPTVYVWMYAYIAKRGCDSTAARAAALAMYHRHVDEGKSPAYVKTPHPGGANITLDVPAWVPAFIKTGKVTIPTIEEVLTGPRPANFMYVPPGSRQAYSDELKAAKAAGLHDNDAADRAFAAAYIETLKNQRGR